MTYKLIYADPPWTYRDRCNAGRRGACHKYNVMAVDEICALDVQSLADPTGCLLAMWWTGPLAADALQVVEAWGFELKTMTGFTWAKRTARGKWHFGMGHLTRANAENCLFATMGKVQRVSAGVPQLVEAPVLEHSRKPDEVATRLEDLLGDVPRIELFARRKRSGWHVWGDQVVSDVEVPG